MPYNFLKNLLLLVAATVLSTGFTACKEDPVPPIEGPINWGEIEYVDCGLPQFPTDTSMQVSYILFDFIENFSNKFLCNEVFFIKGVAQSFVNEYGINIKLIDDLKRNFPKDVDTFTVWGAYPSYPSYSFFYRMDYMSWYNIQDTLLMLLFPGRDLPTGWNLPLFCEKEGDYTTIPCGQSTLKLVNGNVRVWIQPTMEVVTMSYSDFIKELKKELKK